jgi:hypothetical protein
MTTGPAFPTLSFHIGPDHLSERTGPCSDCKAITCSLAKTTGVAQLLRGPKVHEVLGSAGGKHAPADSNHNTTQQHRLQPRSPGRVTERTTNHGPTTERPRRHARRHRRGAKDIQYRIEPHCESGPEQPCQRAGYAPHAQGPLCQEHRAEDQAGRRLSCVSDGQWRRSVPLLPPLRHLRT